MSAWVPYLGLDWNPSGDPDSLEEAKATGVTCYSLSRIVLREVYGKEIPKYPWSGVGGEETDDPQPGDICCMAARDQDRAMHMGVVMEGGYVLHIEAEGLVTAEPMEELKCRIIRHLRIG